MMEDEEKHTLGLSDIERVLLVLHDFADSARRATAAMERLADAVERNDPFLMEKAFADKAHAPRSTASRPDQGDWHDG